QPREKSVRRTPTRQLPLFCPYSEAITRPPEGLLRKALNENVLRCLLVAFTCCLAVLFAMILAVCKRRSRLLELGFEPVHARSDVHDKRDIEPHGGGHFVHDERPEFGQFIRRTLEN